MFNHVVRRKKLQLKPIPSAYMHHVLFISQTVHLDHVLQILMQLIALIEQLLPNQSAYFVHYHDLDWFFF